MPDFELWRTKQFRHLPINRVRNLIGEQVFSSAWSELMVQKPEHDDPNESLGAVLHEYCGQLTQRVATVAATFICWLGTQGGEVYLDAAERLFEQAENSRREAYLMAWSLHNLRRYHTSSGFRCVEMILAKDTNSLDIPAVSLADLEVVDHLVQWLGDDDGQAWLKQCLNEVDRRRAERDLHDHLENNLRGGRGQADLVMAQAARVFRHDAPLGE
jgi:hypothetical protein